MLLDIMEKVILKLLGKLRLEQRQAARDNLSKLYEFRTGSLCSGSGMDHAVAERLVGFLKPEIAVRCVYACESIPKKQDWLMNVMLPSIDAEEGCCVFKDQRHEPILSSLFVAKTY